MGLQTREEVFLSAETDRDIAACLGIQFKFLKYHLYILSDSDKYEEFEISKRNGGTRKITAPISTIKLLQSNLNDLLQKIYEVKPNIHGFIPDRSIKSNALYHVKKKHLINVDIDNFFPSINFGRVRGLFLSYPFLFNEEVATVLAQISCYKGSLPQGAPSSPIISNFICWRLDNDLRKFLSNHKLVFTRYADDITISTNLKKIPYEVATIIDNKIHLSEKLIDVFHTNGFKIKEGKTRYASRFNRQEVTGLIVNKFVNINRKYVRHVRAMLHAWEKHGLVLAANEHFNKYNYKHKQISSPELSFKREIVGKVGYIGFIKGKGDSVYKSILTRLQVLAPEVALTMLQNEIERSENPIIFGEGKTDWKHLKKALEKLKKQGLFLNLYLNFHQYDDTISINNDQLLDICSSLAKTNLHNKTVICLFDRDVKQINSKVIENGQSFKHWGNNVYSLLLPLTPHRNFDQICIEHLYTDEELNRKDSNGRRIYLTTEFDSETGEHKTLANVKYKKPNELKVPYPRILDHSVLDVNGVNIALAKNDFAENILTDVKGFHDFTFTHFQDVFNLIQKIISSNNT